MFAPLLIVIVMDSSELDLDRVKYHHLVYFMIHQPLSGEETQSVFLLIMSQHSGVIPGMGTVFAPRLNWTSGTWPGHLIPSSSHLLTSLSSHTPHYGCHDIFVCIFYVLLFCGLIIILLCSRLTRCWLPSKGMKSQAAPGLTGLFICLTYTKISTRSPLPPSLQPTQSHPSSEPDI